MLAVFFALAVAIFSPTSLLAQSGTGIIEGRVYNSSTGRALSNAHIAVDGTDREAVTDDTGAYRLTGVPAGAARVTVSYVGMQPQSAAVNVTAGGSTQREFELAFAIATVTKPGEETVKLDAFSVTADREMSARAISLNEQRNAPNIKNVVATDEFGNRGAENIGEVLLFLPGVSIATSGPEATTVSLRGFPGNNSGLTVDGADSPATFNGNSRALDLREVPMNNVSRVEVTKVPTPDMPASGLGGSINLISRNGFEAKVPKFTLNAYTMFHNHNGITFDGGHQNADSSTTAARVEPSFDFSYLYPVNKNLAFTLGGARTWRAKPMETGTKDTDESATWDLVRLVQTTSQWNSLAQITKTLQGQVGVDWRISPADTISTNMQYRKYDLAITRSVLGFAFGAGATGGSTFTQGAATGVGTVTMNGSGENVEGITQTKLYNLKYRHRGDLWKLDVTGSYSTSGSNRPDIDNGYFNTTPSTLANVIIRGDNLQNSSGIIPTRYTVTDRTGAPINYLDGGNYSINTVNTNQVDWNSQVYQLRADLSRDFLGPIPFTLKTGVYSNTLQNDQRRYPITWNFRPNGATDVTSRLASKFDVFDNAFNDDGPTLYGQKVRWISGKKLYDLYQKNPSWFVSDDATTWQNYVSNSRSLTERISATYLRADTRLFKNRLWLVGGVRFERTDDIGSGPLDNINAQYQKNANGTLVDGNPNVAGIQPVFLTNDLVARAKLRYTERGATSDRNYHGYYPSLNASFTIMEGLILRAAYAETIGRPNINFIIPGTTITGGDTATPTITVNNSGLKPWSARNYDLSLESYQMKDGFASIGVFQKNIKDFFAVTNTIATPELLDLYGLGGDPSLVGYTISTRSNGGDAKITGFEFSYRQSLTFLPQWARGFQVFVNGTKLSLQGSNTADFSGYTPKSASAGITFARSRLRLKGTVSYTGDISTGLVATSATIPAGTYNYQGKRTRIGFDATYDLTKRYTIYASLQDLGGFVQNLQRYNDSTPDYAKGMRRQELGFYTTIGVTAKF